MRHETYNVGVRQSTSCNRLRYRCANSDSPRLAFTPTLACGTSLPAAGILTLLRHVFTLCWRPRLPLDKITENLGTSTVENSSPKFFAEFTPTGFEPGSGLEMDFRNQHPRKHRKPRITRFKHFGPNSPQRYFLGLV